MVAGGVHARERILAHGDLPVAHVALPLLDGGLRAGRHFGWLLEESKDLRVQEVEWSKVLWEDRVCGVGKNSFVTYGEGLIIYHRLLAPSCKANCSRASSTAIKKNRASSNRTLIAISSVPPV